MGSPSIALDAGQRSAAEPLQVIHLDADCVVVMKPAGRLSVPGRGEMAAGSVAEEVTARWPDAKVVHRLDMATSGLLLFARGLAMQHAFGRMFERRQIDKRYVAVVRGRLGRTVGDSGQIDLPLVADWPNRPRQIVDASNGKASTSRWQVLAHDFDSDRSRVALQPITGRSHQLRVHLLAIGHPIVGDLLYGGAEAAAEAPRLLLHAETLSFDHPVGGTRVTLHSPATF